MSNFTFSFSVRTSSTSLTRIHWILRQDQKHSSYSILHHLILQCHPPCHRSSPRGLLWQQWWRSWLPSKGDQNWGTQRLDRPWRPLRGLNVAQVRHGSSQIHERKILSGHVARGFPWKSFETKIDFDSFRRVRIKTSVSGKAANPGIHHGITSWAFGTFVSGYWPNWGFTSTNHQLCQTYHSLKYLF